MTRSREELKSLMEKKFDEFYKSLLSELSEVIQKFVDRGKQEIQLLFDKIARELGNVEELANSVAVIQEHVKKLQESNDLLRKQNSMLH